MTGTWQKSSITLAGITTVGEAMDVPLVTGSTLRIGGDMVLGSRMTGCVGCVGVTSHLTARKSTRPGDVLLMTQGAGGGTIATAAIYSGFPEVVEQTINLNFLITCEQLIQDPVFSAIHAMTDVTNGGLRGDAYEMAETANCRIVIREEEARTLVEPHVRDMLESLRIDYLGVSLDSLLIVAPQTVSGEMSGLCGQRVWNAMKSGTWRKENRNRCSWLTAKSRISCHGSASRHIPR